MKIKITTLFSAAILILVISTFFNTKLKNIFIGPIGILLSNVKEGNFESCQDLLDHNININLNKFEWTYRIKKMDDRLIVNFTSSEIDNRNFKYQMADMHVLDKNISNELFLELSQVSLEKCDKTVKKQVKKSNYLANYTLCSYKGENFVHYDIPSKNIMITFYPYLESDSQKFYDFLEGIEID